MWSYTVRPCFKISRLKWSLPRSDRAGEAAPVLRDLRQRLENLLDVGRQGEVGVGQHSRQREQPYGRARGSKGPCKPLGILGQKVHQPWARDSPTNLSNVRDEMGEGR